MPRNTPCSANDYHYGTLTQVTLPTGATVTFNYQTIDSTHSFDVSDRRVTSVSMSGASLTNCASNGTSAGQTWSLCYKLSPYPTFPSMSYTTEIDITQPPDATGSNNEIIYTGSGSPPPGLTPITFVPFSKSIYQGSSQGSTPLQQDTWVNNQYNQVTDISTQVNGQPFKDIKYDYWANGLPMVKSKREYDQGGNLMRETDVTFTTNLGPPVGGNSPNLVFPHFIDRPLSVTLYGAGDR
jgi:hypothetical protein